MAHKNGLNIIGEIRNLNKKLIKSVVYHNLEVGIHKLSQEQYNF